MQVIAKQRYDENYTPTVEWAYLQYAVTESLDVRAGRVVLPVFITSEYRKVGYANPWVRPPQEVYRTVPKTDRRLRFNLPWTTGWLHQHRARPLRRDRRDRGG